MLPADEDAVLRSTAALAVDDAAADEVALEPDVPAVPGLVAAGVVPVLLPQPERAAARARMARPAPR
jgi:hypothetical protein